MGVQTEGDTLEILSLFNKCGIKEEGAAKRPLLRIVLIHRSIDVKS